jgi:hypothetical protein
MPEEPERETSKAYLFSKAEGLANDLSALREHYAVADALALHFRRLTLRTLNVLFVLGVFIALFLKLSSPSQLAAPLVGSSWPTYFYYGTIALAFLVYLWSRWRNYETKYQDYRALAEGLRVQFFWRLASLRESVSDHYLRMQRGELSWIRNAIQAWTMPSTAQGAGHVRERLDAMRLVLAHWIEDQHAYFVRVVRRDQQALKRLQTWAYGFLVVGLPWAGLELLSAIYPHGAIVSRMPGGIAAVALGLLLIIGALLLLYIKISALSEHTKQYGRMSIIFATADERLKQALADENYARAEAIVSELGEEALIENGIWVMMHRDRSVEMSQITKFP